MNVYAYANIYSGLKTDEEKESFVTNHMNIQYVPILKKIEACKQSILFNEDEVLQYIYYFMQLFAMYTDIEVSLGEDITDQYDRLKQLGLLDMVLGLIPSFEFDEFNFILTVIKGKK